MDRSTPSGVGRAPSVRLSLAVLVVGCVLPIAILAAFLIVNFYEEGRTRLSTNAVSQARSMVAVVDREVASTQAALSALGTSDLLAKDDLAGFHHQALGALRNMQADNIVLLDTTGQLLLTTRRPFGTPLPKLASPPLLKRTLQTGKAGVSDLFVGPVAGHPIVTIAVPVKRNGVIVYSLNATVEPHQLSSVLKDQKLPTSWRVGVIDGAGSIVARTHDAEKFVGKKVTQTLLTRMNLADEDTFESKTLEGVPVLTAYSRSPSTRWSMAIGMPLDELTAGLRQTLSWLIVATLAALAGGLSLAWFIGGRIARSITALTRPALALGSGQRVAIPSLHFREANQMRQALLDAGATLDRAQYDAQHDGLTGLANRVLFHIVVNQQLAMCRRNATELAVLYVDLDGFKAVNDRHGHAVGDQLLRAVAARIKSSIRESDVAARLGGDEFAVALIHAGLDNAKIFADKLVELVSNPYQLGEIEAKISASIGVAAYPVSATDVDTLLKKADQAMYQAKASSKQRVRAATRTKSATEA